MPSSPSCRPTGRRPGGDWSRLSRGWAARIDARIAELERLKLGLTECIGCGCLSLDRCKLANPGDRAAGLGQGPRYWIGDRLGHGLSYRCRERATITTGVPASA